jgi:phosphoadenosine phosphosulfate reductase
LIEPNEVEELGRSLEGFAPAAILDIAAERFAPLGFAIGFGVEGCVVFDLIARGGLNVDAFTLDTGLLFAETRSLWQTLEARYGRRIRAVRPERTVEEQAAEFGDRLWERDPESCCAMRKIAPLRATLAGFAGWISGVRRDQTRDRSSIGVVEWDGRFGLVKVNPLAAWSEADVWSYVRGNDVPFNPLHLSGYPSIGCVPCTSPVRPGEDPRAGRWRGREKKECGIHSRGPALPTWTEAEADRKEEAHAR